ncbi:PPE family protein [Mycobacterium sp. 663a-19]|uniref:PPE family protein n=1 Tax=Mycobacterium sp. 663a-19 TaxID=2986148 RepID=UPI002D1F3EB4|nr:PPE family protein [Mycobacterium sp. 663a-19]MEB3980960.1 PPE family protein [Mycobacterium sp. 663a-19]
MDFAALPPEINSARMYAGPGSGPMLAAAAAWDGLAAGLRGTAASYGLVVSDLASGPWLGPASVSMAAAAAPYVAWMRATAEQAEQTAVQAMAAAAAYEAAFAMTVPPPVIAANRSLLMALIATNFLGQNTPAIAATQAQYAEMWAQDATAMYAYAGQSAAAYALTPFAPPAPTTNPAGLAGQAAATAQAAAAPAGTAQTTISSAALQVMSAAPQALQGLAQPLLATAPAFAALLPSLLAPVNLGVSSAGLGGSYTSAGFAARYDPEGAGKLDTILSRLGVAPEIGPATPGLVSPGSVNAGLARAASVAALSVPQGWAMAAPEIRLAAAALPNAGVGPAPAVAAGTPGSLLSELALAGMAGRAMGGRSPGATAAQRQTPTLTIVIQSAT